MKLTISLFLFACFSSLYLKAQTPTFKSYSQFDFVAGEKVVAFEDFSQAAIGDFPVKWNGNGSGEVVTLEGLPGRWLQFNANTQAFPTFVNDLPENFTLEFEMAANPEETYLSRWLGMFFTPHIETTKLFGAHNQGKVELTFSPYFKTGETSVLVYDGAGKKMFQNRARTIKFACPQKSVVKVAIWRQKGRLRVYLDEEKIWDVPNAFDEATRYKKFLFKVNNLRPNQYFYISGFRLAVGLPDTRSKLITDGRFVTTGILFDSNSDKIKPESYGTLKQIAQVLQENAEVKVRIIGHTDSDGDDAKNLDLSKRRAAAVKDNLIREFGIEGARFQTDGKGESQPTTPNTTSEGKANNRRVEFVKI